MDNRNLPLDLVPPIIEHLQDDIYTLKAVSLASRAFRVEGQRHLFRTVTQLEDVYDHISFLTAITSSSVLAPFVQEYAQVDLLDAESQEEPLWGLTCHGLQVMVNLKVLIFRSVNGSPSSPILHGCTFQLEEFTWGSFDPAEHVYDFLQAQPTLVTLKVDWMEESPELDTAAICPRLEVLHGNDRTINAFLPGREVFALKWSPDHTEWPFDEEIPHLSQELHRIRFLSFGGLLDRPPLSLITPHLQALEVLELVDFEFIDELELLSELPRLQVFILTDPSDNEFEDLLAPELRSEYFPRIFEECKVLQYIDYKVDRRMYERWFRGGIEAAYCSMEVDSVFEPWWNIF